MDSKEATCFATWMNNFSSQGPSHEELSNLAHNLILKAVSESNEKKPFSSLTRFTSSQSIISSESIVSWKGVSHRWFTNVFLKCAEVQELLHFECPMWFVRNYCVEKLLPSEPNNSSICLAEYLEANQSKTIDDVVISDPNVFISYTGAYTLSVFADLIKSYNEFNQDDIFLWSDLFCVDQIGWRRQTNEYKKEFMYQLKEKISLTPRTLLLIDSWDSVLNALGQIWVLWEIYCCVEAAKEFRVVLSDSEIKRTILEDDMFYENGHTRLFDGLAEIDVRKAESRHEADKVLIMGIIEEGQGASFVNSKVIRTLQGWHLSNCEGAVELGLGYLEGNDEFMINGALNSILHIAWWFHELGRSEYAMILFKKILPICKLRHGEDAEITCNVVTNLAHIFISYKKNLDEAEEMLRITYEKYCEKFGREHLQSCKSAANLAGAYSANGKYNLALNFYKEVADTLSDFEDEDCFELWSSTMLNLADQYYFMGNHEEAVRYASLSYSKTLDQRGARHPTTLFCLGKYADRVSSSGQHRKAEKLYSESLQICQEMFGDLHVQTLDTMHNYAENQYLARSYSMAEELFIRAISGYKAISDDDSVCADSMQGLGMVYFRQGKTEEALELLKKARKINERTRGKNHRVVYESIVRIALVLDSTGRQEEAVRISRAAHAGFREQYGDGEMELVFKSLFEGSALYERILV